MRILWVSVLVYGVVLVAGFYYALTGLSPDPNPLRLAAFTLAIALLTTLEFTGPHNPTARTAIRLALFTATAALDESGLSRVLFLLVPFLAYLQFGRRAGLALGALCLTLLLSGYLLWTPDWYTDATAVSDVLMFCVGLILALSMAAMATTAREAQHHVAELSADIERTRLARDIHDGLGHHLTAIAVQLEKAEAYRDLDPTTADQAIHHARQSARQALEEVRSSVRSMRSDTTPFDLPAALADLTHDTDVNLTVIGNQNDTDRAALATLYRAAQESLTNARKHARATTIAATLTFGPHDTSLEITDNGTGFTPTTPEGFGLKGMRERAALVGGRVDVDSHPHTGTRITIVVPS